MLDCRMGFRVGIFSQNERQLSWVLGPWSLFEDGGEGLGMYESGVVLRL